MKQSASMSALGASSSGPSKLTKLLATRSPGAQASTQDPWFENAVRPLPSAFWAPTATTESNAAGQKTRSLALLPAAATTTVSAPSRWIAWDSSAGGRSFQV